MKNNKYTCEHGLKRSNEYLAKIRKSGKVLAEAGFVKNDWNSARARAEFRYSPILE
jgi:hypothetical protein